MEVFKAAIDGLGIAPGVTTDLVVELAELAKGDELKADEKWVARIRKAIKPLDVMPRIKSQLHTAARKELDTEAMKYHRRTGKFKAVTDGDIETLYQEKLEAYLAKKAEKEAKKKAITKAS
ncbi:MAG: hypothetical protein C0617_11055 [Desulfuromonas sp.]|nr:MAG: hypothetical protein C0617_11055 [Desulfuromonas sp.]